MIWSRKAGAKVLLGLLNKEPHIFLEDIHCFKVVRYCSGITHSTEPFFGVSFMLQWFDHHKCSQLWITALKEIAHRPIQASMVYLKGYTTDLAAHHRAVLPHKKKKGVLFNKTKHLKWNLVWSPSFFPVTSPFLLSLHSSAPVLHLDHVASLRTLCTYLHNGMYQIKGTINDLSGDTLNIKTKYCISVKTDRSGKKPSLCTCSNIYMKKIIM